MRLTGPIRAALLASAAALAAAFPARAQEEPFGQAISLDEITIVPSRTAETATESMSGTSIVSSDDLERLQPSTPGEIFQGMPGVSASSDGNPTSTNINIRGLQDAGRVAVIVDGARRNFQINGHRNGTPQWIEPEMLKSVTVVRGPVSNIYGSGAIGGVVAFETKEAEDFLRPEEMAAGEMKAGFETNGEGMLGRATAAARLTPEISAIGSLVYRERDDYRDGDGNDVPGTGFDILGGHAKATIRPSDVSKITLGWIGDRQDWTDADGETATKLEQDTFTGAFEYGDPSMPWVDLKVSGYVNNTTLRQSRLTEDEIFAGYEGITPLFVREKAGTYREYDLLTAGFDAHNTSRFDTGTLSHTLTYGGDWFRDKVDTADTAGIRDAFNPSGKRSAYGAFVQDRVEYEDWFELLAALRFDGYRLDGGHTKTQGDRISPRVTVGVKPFERTDFHGIQVYGTYAEGYRAPSVGETLITGLHPVQQAPFSFLPNPSLEPETAHTFEVGLNIERNDFLVSGDGLRVKASWFQNEVDDYIELNGLFAGNTAGCSDVSFIVVDTPGGAFPVEWPGDEPDCYQYQNINKARLKGFEFEGIYDAGGYFAGLRGHVIRGDNLETGVPLRTVPADQLTALVGVRLLDETLILGGEAQFVAGQDRLPPESQPTDSHTLVNLFASYTPTEDFRLDARLENVFDVSYRDHLNPSLGTYKEPGFSAKLAATFRFGVAGRGIFDE